MCHTNIEPLKRAHVRDFHIDGWFGMGKIAGVEQTYQSISLWIRWRTHAIMFYSYNQSICKDNHTYYKYVTHIEGRCVLSRTRRVVP